MENDNLAVEDVARICHEANKALCDGMEDHSQAHWDYVAHWQKESAIEGVKFHLDNPDADANASHNKWCKDKLLAGWKFGKDKNEDAKTHPCLVDFDELPPLQQAKDHLFKGIVHSMKDFIAQA